MAQLLRTQQSTELLLHAAQRDDLSMFEYLVEHGAAIPSDVDQSIAAMLQRRQDWIDQATTLSQNWRIPLTGVRVIHEYVVGFNWAVVREAFATFGSKCISAHIT